MRRSAGGVLIGNSRRRSDSVIAAIGCAALLASLAIRATALEARWLGSATCTLDTKAAGYSERQVHRWSISPVGAVTHPAAGEALYPADWVETGHGSKQGVIWSINARAASALLFSARANGELHIALSGLQRDPKGITVQTVDSSGRMNTSGVPSAAWPFPPIAAPAHAKHVTSGPVAVPVTSPVGYLDPGSDPHSRIRSASTASCSWDFRRAPPM